jgi:predicted nucleic acid-binding protein
MSPLGSPRAVKMILVLDASMALAWVFERLDAAEQDCADRALGALAVTSAVVPSLWQVEVANGLLVGERRKVIELVQSQDFLRRLVNLPIRVNNKLPVAHTHEVLRIARQYGLTAYDACYVDLALRTGGTLATFDMKLANAGSAAGVSVFH